jgi:hypothetical protein
MHDSLFLPGILRETAYAHSTIDGCTHTQAHTHTNTTGANQNKHRTSKHTRQGDMMKHPTFDAKPQAFVEGTHLPTESRTPFAYPYPSIPLSMTWLHSGCKFTHQQQGQCTQNWGFGVQPGETERCLQSPHSGRAPTLRSCSETRTQCPATVHSACQAQSQAQHSCLRVTFIKTQAPLY